jgi:hypothetical protein
MRAIPFSTEETVIPAFIGLETSENVYVPLPLAAV